MNRNSSTAEAGYWLGQHATGHGVAPRAAGAAVGRLFGEEGLHRVEMQCAAANAGSRAIAERLTDRYLDHVIYGMLESGWPLA